MEHVEIGSSEDGAAPPSPEPPRARRAGDAMAMRSAAKRARGGYGGGEGDGRPDAVPSRRRRGGRARVLTERAHVRVQEGRRRGRGGRRTAEDDARDHRRGAIGEGEGVSWGAESVREANRDIRRRPSNGPVWSGVPSYQRESPSSAQNVKMHVGRREREHLGRGRGPRRTGRLGSRIRRRRTSWSSEKLARRVGVGAARRQRDGRAFRHEPTTSVPTRADARSRPRL